jgi:hypothetical protein
MACIWGLIYFIYRTYGESVCAQPIHTPHTPINSLYTPFSTFSTTHPLFYILYPIGAMSKASAYSVEGDIASKANSQKPGASKSNSNSNSNSMRPDKGDKGVGSISGEKEHEPKSDRATEVLSTEVLSIKLVKSNDKGDSTSLYNDFDDDQSSDEEEEEERSGSRGTRDDTVRVRVERKDISYNSSSSHNTHDTSTSRTAGRVSPRGRDQSAPSPPSPTHSVSSSNSSMIENSSVGSSIVGSSGAPLSAK